MSLVASLKALAAAGGTPEQLIAIVEAHEAARADALEKRRAADAARQQAHRQRNNVTSRDVTVTPRDSRDPAPHVGERSAQVVIPSLPSLRSEEVKPVSPDGDTTPLKPKLAKPNGFARFWEAYPSKVGRPVAEKAYAKALKRISGPDPPSEILAGVARAKASRKWREGIIPNPSTWLNQDRWEDQPSEIEPRHERPHHDAKHEARQANLARAFAGADSAARQRWEP
jgi:hypothetical protein